MSQVNIILIYKGSEVARLENYQGDKEKIEIGMAFELTDFKNNLQCIVIATKIKKYQYDSYIEYIIEVEDEVVC